VRAGGIRCECHGSVFSIEDGSAVNPPATAPLEEVSITVEGDEISIA
jgi:nitrite reductase/ring-hydroxylating ferredoxin subunit